MANFECIITSRPVEGVGSIQINRPEVLNALSLRTMTEIVTAMEAFNNSPDIRCIVIYGNDKAFAAGADIKEMSSATAMEMLYRDQFAKWERIRKIHKPVIAGVSGFALGGGCELAMSCDMIVAAASARFGQPEIKLGVMPGAGGTQRLTRAIGKARAMELVLTGRFMSAKEAFEAGLVTKVVENDVWLEEVITLAQAVAAMPPVAVRLAKEAVLKSFDTTIETGMEFERKNFYLLFASEDAAEGMSAFVEKRKPTWKGK